jgi:D-alanyl-D-alanine dipeptidase
MATLENSAAILHLQLEAPDAGEYIELYGVDFVAPNKDQHDSFARLCDDMAAKRQALEGVCTEFGIAVTKQATLYRPSTFLAAPLSKEQVTAINERETSSIAEYCVGVQADLAAVPIVESLEPMTHLPTMLERTSVAATFSGAPFHAACGEWGGKQREFWVREGVAARLMVMGKVLEGAGVSLHFEDAFRPMGVQEGLFKRRVDWTRRDHPEWTEEQIITEAQSKTAVMPRLASHKGGAAVDARLRDTQGTLADFGHNYPDGGALVFPRTPFVTAEQWQNRQLLQVAAGLSDLTLYVGEDWHVSSGDNLASLDEHGTVRSDFVAKYGPIKEFDRRTGAITTPYDQAEMNQVFPY